jgi:pyruvate dehydrogenase E2 component (dihydrolipoamide acetyltransferase)
MAFEFKLPDIGEGVVEGEIVSWKVAVGDRVALDQPLVEVMTDKATVEIPSPRAGIIQKLGFRVGDICPVGAVLVVIDDSATAPAAGAAAAAPPPAQPPAPAQPSVPAAPSTGRPASQAASGTASFTAPGAALGAGGAQPAGRVKSTPATRRLAREMGVDLGRVEATGRRGRVTSDDVRRVAASEFTHDEPTLVNMRAPEVATQLAPAAPARGFAPMAVPAQGAEERIPLRGLRKRIADNMVRSTQTAAHFTYVEEIDMTELVTVRERARERAAERGIKLTFLPFLIKAVVSGLKRWPQLNASLDETTQEIVRKKYYHVGIASQGPQGLMVTVVRDADQRSIFGLASEIQRLAKAVQDGNVRREELTGSTFTITSLGKLGGVMATPIINFPEVGILGVHEMKERPAVKDGQIVIRWLMNLSISLDHRLVDGWDGAMFLQDVKALLEDPTTMFLEMV